MRESASTDLREPQGSNPLGPPGPEPEIRCQFIILARKDELTPDLTWTKLARLRNCWLTPALGDGLIWLWVNWITPSSDTEGPYLGHPGLISYTQFPKE